MPKAPASGDRIAATPGRIRSRRSTGCLALAKFGNRKRDRGTGGWDARRPVGPGRASTGEAQAGTSPDTQQEIIARLDLIEQQVTEYHRRSAHRESVIDHLHAENQELRDNARRSVFEPVAADLVRLYDSLGKEAGRLT